MSAVVFRWTQRWGRKVWAPAQLGSNPFSPLGTEIGTLHYSFCWISFCLLRHRALFFFLFLHLFFFFFLDSSRDSSVVFWDFFSLELFQFGFCFFSPLCSQEPAGVAPGENELAKERTPEPSSFTCCEEEESNARKVPI